jgi:hypothetical protein
MSAELDSRYRKTFRMGRSGKNALVDAETGDCNRELHNSRLLSTNLLSIRSPNLRSSCFAWHVHILASPLKANVFLNRATELNHPSETSFGIIGEVRTRSGE